MLVEYVLSYVEFPSQLRDNCTGPDVPVCEIPLTTTCIVTPFSGVWPEVGVEVTFTDKADAATLVGLNRYADSEAIMIKPINNPIICISFLYVFIYIALWRYLFYRWIGNSNRGRETIIAVRIGTAQGIGRGFGRRNNTRAR